MKKLKKGSYEQENLKKDNSEKWKSENGVSGKEELDRNNMFAT